MSTPEIESTKFALEAAKEYVDLILKPSAATIGEILNDALMPWKTKNKVRVLVKCRKICAEKGFKPEQIEPDIFVPLIEEAGNTEDETLSDMFANLLAGHLNPDSKDNIHPSYAKTLGQFSSIDAIVLKDFYRLQGTKDNFNEGISSTILKMELYPTLKILQIYMSLEFLHRIGILSRVVRKSLSHTLITKDKFDITYYGLKFCEACEI